MSGTSTCDACEAKRTIDTPYTVNGHLELALENVTKYVSDEADWFRSTVVSTIAMLAHDKRYHLVHDLSTELSVYFYVYDAEWNLHVWVEINLYDVTVNWHSKAVTDSYDGRIVLPRSVIDRDIVRAVEIAFKAQE